MSSPGLQRSLAGSLALLALVAAPRSTRAQDEAPADLPPADERAPDTPAETPPPRPSDDAPAESAPPPAAPAPPPPARTAPGQPVRGRAIDAATAAGVAGARITVAGTPAATETDRNGRFTLSGLPPGNYTLEASKPPFEPVVVDFTVTDDRGEPVEILFIGDIQEIEVRQVGRREVPAPGGTQLVREEIAKVPGARGDVLTAVQSLPGIANLGGIGADSGPGLVIRGSSPSDSRIFVDGFDVPILYHFGGVQSILPSEFIQDIRYAPGGFGVDHGWASSGIVDVTTRAPADDWSGFAELSFINLGAYLRGPIGAPENKLTFAVAARRSIIDFILPAVVPDDAGLSFTAVPRYYDWQARIDWQATSRWRLSLFHFGTDDGAEIVSTLDNASDPTLSGTFSNQTFFQRTIASAVYESARLRSRFAASVQTYDFSFSISDDRFIAFPGWGLGVRQETTVKAAEGVRFHAGAEADSNSWDARGKLPRPPREGDPRDPNFTYDPIVEFNQHTSQANVGAWLSGEWKRTKYLEVTAGARFDEFTRVKKHVIQPRAEIASNLGVVTVRAAGGLYTRPPDWNDEVLQTNLGPEKSWQTTLGVERELAKGISAQLTGFYNLRSDLIVFDSSRLDPNNAAATTYVNRGEGKTYGAELFASWRGLNHFAWLAYTLSRSLRRDGPGLPERLFDYDQTHNLIALGSYKFGKRRRWQIGGRFQYTTGIPYTPVTGTTFISDLNYYRPSYGAVNSARFEAMHQLDLRIDRAWPFESWKLTAYLDITNVYAHTSPLGYQYSYNYTEREPFSTFPFLPALGVRGEF